MRTPLPTLRVLKVVAVSTAVLATSLSLAPAALAASPAAPLATAYTSGTCTASLNKTVVVKGQSIVVTEVVKGGATTVSVTISSTPTSLTVVPPDANGTSSYTIDSTNLELGAHTADLVCSDKSTQTLPFTVTAPAVAGGTGNSAGGSGGGSGLAFTGANAVVPLVALGGVLVLGGAGAVLAGRRRRDDTA